MTDAERYALLLAIARVLSERFSEDSHSMSIAPLPASLEVVEKEQECK